MYRILVVDDEPLVRLGITTLLNNLEGITVCDTASNGKEALEKIKECSPHIVITDIKMPVMDGLELIRECKNRYGHNLVFIVLTSYEEFALIREAVSYQVVDYLLKVGIVREELTASVTRALEQLKAYNPVHYAEQNPYLQERFYLNLLNRQIPEPMIERQARELNINLDFRYFSAAYGALQKEVPVAGQLDKEQLETLFFSSLCMLENILKQYIEVKMISLGSSYFVIIFLIREEDPAAANQTMSEGLADAVELLESYFSVKTRMAIGSTVKSAMQLHLSYQEAKAIFDENSRSPVVCYRDYLEKIKKDDKIRFYDAVRRYIDDHITEHISVRTVAETFFITPNYLSASFKSYFGISFVDYVNKQKIEQAKAIMLTSDLKIYEVASQLGFENSYYFSKVFRKVEGMSPSEFISSKFR